MAFSVTTTGYSQSIGSVRFDGSWSGAGACDPDAVHGGRFEWGFNQFNNLTSVTCSSDNAASFSRTVSVDKDRDLLKFRARGACETLFGCTGLSGSEAQGTSIQVGKTYADQASWGTPAASAITGNTATVSAAYTPNTVESSASTSVFYRVNGSGSAYTELSVGSGLSGSAALSQSLGLSGLSSGVTYEFFFRATRNTANLTVLDSSTGTFTTVTTAPTVTTNAASAVGQKSATLNGTVDPNGGASYYFQYGLTVSYGTSTAVQGPSSATDPFAFSAAITGLALNTLYHFRAVATNGDTIVNGDDATFTTLPEQTIVTGGATNVTPTSATLTGTVNPKHASNSVTYRFQYGLTTAYGSLTDPQGPTAGTDDLIFHAAIGSLTPNTLYHWRAVAFTSEHTVNGADSTFTTSSGDAVVLRV